jgi:predicted ATPase/DNA-binding SARP family transcriptional activator
MDAPYDRLYLLGPFGIALAQTEAQTNVSLGNLARPRLRRKSRALIAYLAAAAQPVRREALAALFFPQSDDPLGALRWQLSEIRRQLGSAMVVAQQDTLQLDHRRCWVDAHEFDHMLRRDALSSIEQLTRALGLYRGEYLADVSLPDAPEFDMWLLGRRAHYRQRYELALARLVDRLIQHEQYAQALPWAQQLVQSDALAEPANLQLIRLYALNGQRTAALAHYEQYHRLLRTEIQAPPSPEAAALHAEIAADRLTTLVGPSPRSQSLPPRRHNLPAPTTPFLGREAELAQLRAMLADPSYRLVTLVGPGGVGKTRLALRVAAELIQLPDGSFRDGVYIAPLAAIPSGAALIPAIADAVGLAFSGAGDPRQQLLAYLRAQSLLLVLDNFEQLVDAADLLTDILSSAPGLTILATSRVRLNLYEEWCFELQGLALPDDSIPSSIETSSAVQLFVQRARHIQHSFALETERPAVVRICQLLDGIPLAIELAAGRVRGHTCGEIAYEIQHSLDFLATDLRNIPERHRSMRVAFEHSWRLMRETERVAFARLSVFRGGFDHRAAADVADVTRDTLSALIDSSMLHGAPDGRYQLHELLRQFGADKLTSDVASDIRRRHSRFFAAYIRQQEPLKLTAQEPAALQQIGVELENIRAGWQSAVTDLMDVDQATAAETIADYAPMLAYFFDRRSRYREGLQLFRQTEASLASTPAQPASGAQQPGPALQQASLWIWLGKALFYLRIGEFSEIERLLKPSLPLLRQGSDARLAGEALSLLGVSYMRMGRYDESEQCLQSSLALYTAIGDTTGRTIPLDGLALCAFDQHQFSQAQTYWQACLAIFRSTGYQLGVAKALSGMASNMGRHGKYEEAKQLMEEALPIAEAAGNDQLVAILLGNLGSATRHLSDYQTSVQYFERSLEISRRIGDQRWTAANLNGLGFTLIEMGHMVAAKDYILEALELSKITNNAPDVLDSLSLLGHILAANASVNAVTLLSLVVNHSITRRIARDRSQHLLDQLKEILAPLVWDAASARGKAEALGDIMQFDAQQFFA